MDSKYVPNKPIQLQSTKYLATLRNEKKRPKRQYCGQGFYYDNRYQNIYGLKGANTFLSQIQQN